MVASRAVLPVETARRVTVESTGTRPDLASCDDAPPTHRHLALDTTLDILTHVDRIESLLERHADAIGDDLGPYRGHVYRVLHYARCILDGDESDRATIDVALVHHDIGLWTDREVAYLEPSIARAERDVEELGLDVDLEMLRPIIMWHHKITPYRGPHARVVNAVRRADWCDATKGIVRKGVDRRTVARTVDAIPYDGFHDVLLRIGPELTGGRKLAAARKLMRVLKV